MGEFITIKLTEKQARYLHLVAQDYIDVTKDKDVRRWALQIRAKLIKAKCGFHKEQVDEA